MGCSGDIITNFYDDNMNLINSYSLGVTLFNITKSVDKFMTIEIGR